MTASAPSASAEWRRYYMLPVAAALGYATSVIHIYGLGPFIAPISEEFGWSRTLTTAGLTIAVAVQALFSVPIGIAVDRVGPRKLGLFGIVATCAFFALLATATGDAWNWYLLWGLLAFAVLPVQATIWTSAVASRFEASRGLAFAITLCGAGVAQVVFPALATWLIADFGWRIAIIGQGAFWLVVVLPIIAIFFRGARDAKTTEPQAIPAGEGLSFSEGLRSSIYIRLLLASVLFTFIVLGFVVHFVPILSERGIGLEEAGGIAAIIGFVSIAGRLGTGVLLDRFPASLVGATAFALPAVAALLMLMGGGGWAVLFVAAILVGLTLGAEVDVIVYLTTKHFGLKSFGALYGGLLAALSIGTATGPLVAARIFDVTGSYELFLWITIPVMIGSSLALLTLPQPKFAAGGSGSGA